MDFPILSRMNRIIATILVKDGKKKCAMMKSAVFDSVVKFRYLREISVAARKIILDILVTDRISSALHHKSLQTVFPIFHGREKVDHHNT